MNFKQELILTFIVIIILITSMIISFHILLLVYQLFIFLGAGFLRYLEFGITFSDTNTNSEPFRHTSKFAVIGFSILPFVSRLPSILAGEDDLSVLFHPIIWLMALDMFLAGLLGILIVRQICTRAILNYIPKSSD